MSEFELWDEKLGFVNYRVADEAARLRAKKHWNNFDRKVKEETRRILNAKDPLAEISAVLSRFGLKTKYKLYSSSPSRILTHECYTNNDKAHHVYKPHPDTA